MRPLKKCRDARNLSLPALETLLAGGYGGSKNTLSRLETKPINNVSKNLLIALVEIFKEQGLKTEHIISPEIYSDFIVNYRPINDKNNRQGCDTTFNEQQILLTITKQWIENGTTTRSTFAEALFTKLAIDDLVKALPTTANEFLTWKNTALQRVSRILDEEKPLPLSWKYYWLSCLPEHFKQTALSQMMANSGYMLVPLPANPKINSQETAAKIDVLSRKFADVIGGSKPAMDGAYDHRDDVAELQFFQDTLMELAAGCLREATVIKTCTGITSKLEHIWANSPLNS
jgi:hypothetical protein